MHTVPDYWKHPDNPQAVAELDAATREKAAAFGIPRSFFPPPPDVPRPKGDIVWTLQSDEHLYQVEKVDPPILRGAGMRTHRLWRNGSPCIGHQWCYSLEDAQWWAQWDAECDLKMQNARLRERVCKLESELANRSIAIQPY